MCPETPSTNVWLANQKLLGSTYSRTRNGLSFALALRGIQRHTHLDASVRVLDVGGGFGLMAVLLARLGCFVTVLDPDPGMLGRAQRLLARESCAVQQRVHFRRGVAPDDLQEGGNYDIVCCHSVLMYLPDPWPTLRRLPSVVRPGGLISVSTTSGPAQAARAALQRRWSTAALLLAESGPDEESIPVHNHSRESIVGFMRARECELLGWYGIGVFADHLSREQVEDRFSDIVQVEWLAGCRDPYRQIARNYHCLFRTALPRRCK